MENQEVKHITLNGKYKMVIERAASTKGIDGFKVEANGDDLSNLEVDIRLLYGKAKDLTATAIPEVK